MRTCAGAACTQLTVRHLMKGLGILGTRTASGAGLVLCTKSRDHGGFIGKISQERERAPAPRATECTNSGMHTHPSGDGTCMGCIPQCDAGPRPPLGTHKGEQQLPCDTEDTPPNKGYKGAQTPHPRAGACRMTSSRCWSAPTRYGLAGTHRRPAHCTPASVIKSTQLSPSSALGGGG